MIYYISFSRPGDIAQLVERLNGIEKVRGSTPLISTSSNDRNERFFFIPMMCRLRRALAEKRRYKIRDESFTVEYDAASQGMMKPHRSTF